jgi:predicted nuclease of predicted toxin-antitoxin system
VTQPRYLADENVPLHAVRRLAQSGIDIESASGVLPGVADEDILAYATRNGQVVISFDKDFGRLVFVERLVPPGVVLLRFSPRSPEVIHDMLSRLLTSGIALVGYFTVVTDRRVRSVPLPRQ